MVPERERYSNGLDHALLGRTVKHLKLWAVYVGNGRGKKSGAAQALWNSAHATQALEDGCQTMGL